VTCSNGIVTELSLPSNNLTGGLPAELFLLSELTVLDVFDNNLYNAYLDNNFLQKMTSLTHLNLGQNYLLNDGLPAVLSSLTDLQVLDVSYNLYNGVLDGSILAPLTSLTRLVLSGNSYNSPLPTQLWTSLTNLQSLYVEFADLVGPLEIQSSNSVQDLWLNWNPDLGGSFDDLSLLLPQLTSLSMVSCGLTGALPTLPSTIQSVFLANNTLSGAVPDSYAQLGNLASLTVQDNDLTSLPFCVNDVLTYLAADCDLCTTAGCCSCCGDCLSS
jgi:Leucine-rich repeat (LRR) protein